MIKFFRHIRKHLLKENRFSKYLLYAMGEIILVMIGILLALQVNNWNEQRKESALEQKLLLEYKVELDYNLNALDFSKRTMKRRADKCTLLLKYIKEKLPHTDSLSTYYNVLSIGLGESTLSMSAFNAIAVKGFDHLKNDSLKNRITFLHSYRYKILTHRMENLMLNVRDYGRPIIRNKLKSLGNNKHIPLNYEELMADVSLWNTLTVLQGNYQDLIKVIDNTQNEIREVNQLLDEYID